MRSGWSRSWRQVIRMTVPPREREVEVALAVALEGERVVVRFAAVGLDDELASGQWKSTS